ncbi:zinc finger protein 507 [Stigmatopora argus]
MEDVNSVAVLIAAAAASSSPAPSSENGEQLHAMDAPNSLIQVIEKLSKIVEKRPQRRCSLAGHKRARPRADEGSPREDHRRDGEGERPLTCYQCSLCPYLSPTLALLKEHLKQHNEHNQDLILMCSECRFSSRDQTQLEEHVRMHVEHGAEAKEAEDGPRRDADPVGSECDGDPKEKAKKWYIFEEYGLYRCLICSYVCGQQRMLKTHAWKHAGLLDCSYPVFEEEAPSAPAPAAAVPASARLEAEPRAGSAPFEPPFSDEQTSPAGGGQAEAGEETSAEGSAVEAEDGVRAETASPADSLLTSAQKIINSDRNGTGHMNVIVERLPSAEDAGLAAAPLLLEPEADDGREEGGGDPPRDENVPPAGRKRTHSESLRLHSLAAEVLVAMPMRTAELKADAAELGQDMNQDLKNPEVVVATAAVVAPAGISSSLLTVIERLRERSDQNASDEDILKELRDNANGAGAAGAPPDGPVDYVAGSERPYRCRLCRYSSGSKGYVKQHLRAHRHKRPYQCPICQHVAADSKDLESHMLRHCKSRTHQCKMCTRAFHYKSQLRNHEREHHGGADAAALAAVDETAAEEAEPDADREGDLQKTFKCDICDYTSATYVGVRNHRRIHNSDKPYRCCNCDFATTNMNSLKSHMRRHPQEQQAVQLLEQYRCSLCGYVCSHPPSLKSHMWKHAGDQNYNYEQVNRAINEAISQSTRTPAKSSPDATEVPAGAVPERPAPSPQPPPTGGVEYCVLLFCCCICGLESTSKERLMEHMKEHEGDLISIILNNGKDAP